MELVSFIIMLLLTNIFFLQREIILINFLLKENEVTDMDPLPLTVFIMSCAGIFGSIVAVTLILIIVKPVYNGMYEDVFLKIGGNGNMWEVYKYFTLCKSLLKLDVLISVEFMITIFFLTYNTKESLYYLAVDVVFSLLILGNNIHGHLMVNWKKYKQFTFFVVLRCIIEAFKLYRTVICALGYTINLEKIPDYQTDEDNKTYNLSCIVFEVIGFIAMTFLLFFMRRTIKTFNRNEFDLIRNNFTQDFYKLQRDDPTD